jgi:diaminopimelate epimerase
MRVSNRHTGVGSDGLVLIMPSEIADFRMRIFNADGSEAEMCGNASRCIGKYVFEHGLTTKTDITLETLCGIKHLHLQLENGKVGLVQVNMGMAVVSGKQNMFGRDFVFVSMGNPHAVCFVDDVDAVDTHEEGARMEKAIKGGVNVEFVQIVNRSEIRMRVWERGSGETMACGTGACASVVAAIAEGKTDSMVTVHLRGGDLYIQHTADGIVLMTGTATEVFSGEIQL